LRRRAVRRNRGLVGGGAREDPHLPITSPPSSFYVTQSSR
jgi:hypothetical protein